MISSNYRAAGRRVATVALLAAVAYLTAACGGDADKAGAGASSTPTGVATSAAPLPTQDWNRMACQTLPEEWLDLLDKLDETRRAGEYAAKSTDPRMHEQGEKLLDAVTARETADMNGDQSARAGANIEISEVSLDFAEVCSALYGDGNW